MTSPAKFFPARGDVFEEKYRIHDPIGEGGYAKVYRARDVEMRRDVAIKILTPSTDDNAYDERVVARFLREGRLISELHDPHTITLHDYGRSSSGLLYMVFEFVDGTPLDRLIKQDAPMPPTRVARIMLQVLASLTEAHLVGVLHRDIKPSNLMVYDYLGDTDRVKVLDFGIAKPVASEREVSTELTREGVIIGTPRYMSPEQVIGRELSPASDIFSVGLVALEMLSGERALKGDDDQSILRLLLGPEPVEIPEKILIPAPMRNIIERMVAKEVTERFSSTIEVIEAIHAWLSGRAVDGWIDPETSKTLERVHTADMRNPAARAADAFKGTTRLQWASMIGVFLLGALSTAAVTRVTALEERIKSLRTGGNAEEPVEEPPATLDQYGSPQWMISRDQSDITYKFVGADGLIEVSDVERIPVRAHSLVEILATNVETPDAVRYVTDVEGDGPLRVETRDAEWVEAGQQGIPIAWEIVTNIRGRSIYVSDRVAKSNEEARKRKKDKSKIDFDIHLVKP